MTQNGIGLGPVAASGWCGPCEALFPAAAGSRHCAVRAHVQACFDNEAVLKAEIEAATNAEEIAAVDLIQDGRDFKGPDPLLPSDCS